MENEGIFSGPTEDKNFDAYFESRGESVPGSESEHKSDPENHQISAFEDESAENLEESDAGNDLEPEEDGSELEHEEELEASEEKKKPTPEELANNYKAALKQERYKRQSLEKQYKETQAKQQQLEQQFEQMMQKIYQPQQSQEQMVSYEDDPLEHLRQRNEKLERALQQQNEALQYQGQDMQQQREIQTVVSHCRREAQEFATQTPDYEKAYDYLQNQLQSEYRALGYNDQQVKELVTQDELDIAYRCYNSGTNVGEQLYNIAKARGYQPGQVKAPARNAQTIKNGMTKSKSLGTSGGATENGRISYESLSLMSEKDFDKLWKQYESGSLNM